MASTGQKKTHGWKSTWQWMKMVLKTSTDMDECIEYMLSVNI